MTDRTLDRYRHVLRSDFAAFVSRSFRELQAADEFQFNWHVELIACKLEQVRRGHIKRLIINLPPRQGKSIIGSIAFPAFVLGHNPRTKIMCISYGEDLAEEIADGCRTLMSSGFYQAVFPTRLSDNRQSLGFFKTTEGGSRQSSSITGGLTGRGADLIIIDDPIKGEDSQSEARRKATNEAFYNTIYSRLNDKEKGAIVIIMHRLHVDDLVGYVTERESWDMLVLPGIAEQDEQHYIRTPYGMCRVGRNEGEALHPVRESVALLEDHRSRMSDYVFSAQYQQRPIPKDGGIVKPEWLVYYDTPPGDYDRVIQSWDTATKEGDGNSYHVCTTWGVTGRDYFLLDVYRQRGSFDRLKTDAVRLAKQYQPTTIIIEPQATGSALISELGESGRFNVVAAPVSSEGKTARLEAKIDRFSGGRVHLPRGAYWLKEYVSELTAFPATRYSDQVDSTVQALGEVAPGDDGSFARAMKTMELLSQSPDSEMVRLKLPPGHGTIIGPGGQYVIPDGDGVVLVDTATSARLLQLFPAARRL